MKLLAEWICFLICAYLCLFVQDLGTEKAPKIAQKVCRVFEMGSRTKSRTYIYIYTLLPTSHQNGPHPPKRPFRQNVTLLMSWSCLQSGLVSLFVLICAYLCRTWGQKKAPKIAQKVCRVFEMGSRTRSRTPLYTLPMAPFQLATKTDPIHQNAPSAKTWLFWCHEVACRVDLFPYLCLFVLICAGLGDGKSTKNCSEGLQGFWDGFKNKV